MGVMVMAEGGREVVHATQEASAPAEAKPMYDNEPILRRYSHVFGWVELYAPAAEPSLWNELPWVLKIDKDGGGDGPRKYRVKPSTAYPAYESPGLIESHKYEFK